MSYSFAAQDKIGKKYPAEFQQIAEKYFADFYLYTWEPTGNTPRQKAGIDATVTLTTGKVLNIDTKVDNFAFNRIPLEVFHIHANGTQRHGWALREDYQTDYVVFYKPGKQTGYVLPHKKLLKVLCENYEQWKHCAMNRQDGFWLSSAENRNYTTMNLCVPVPLLKSLLGADLEQVGIGQG